LYDRLAPSKETAHPPSARAKLSVCDTCVTEWSVSSYTSCRYTGFLGVNTVRSPAAVASLALTVNVMSVSAVWRSLRPPGPPGPPPGPPPASAAAASVKVPAEVHFTTKSNLFPGATCAVVSARGALST
jgi:hypothetical protein